MRIAKVKHTRLRRYAFRIAYSVFDVCIPYHFFFVRRLILKLFGAQLHGSCRIYNNVKIFDPNNLKMQSGSTIGPNVAIYNIANVTLLKNATISQNSHICTASHAYKNLEHELLCDDILIGEGAWVAADVFIGPGVNLGTDAVALARSVVIRSVETNSVVAGNPAKPVGERFE